MPLASSQFLLTHFDRLAEATGGIAKLRALVLQLGVQGKLLPQNPADEPAAKLIERVQAEKKRMRAAKLIPPEKEHPAFEDDETPFPIPASWSWQRLSTITHTFGQKVPDHRFTYIDVGAIDNKRGIISEPTVLEAAHAPSRARKIVRKGAVIYSTVRPYLLNTCVIAADFKPEPIASTAFAVLNPHADISAHYLHYYLRSQPFISYVEDKMKGQAYPAINDGDMSVAPIPIPPLTEQRRIVAKVEELMGLCDALEAAQQERETVRARLRTSALHQLASPDSAPKSAAFVLRNLPLVTDAPEDLAFLRQSVLELAVQGRLVAQRPEEGSGLRLLKEIEAAKKIALQEKRVRRLEEFSELGQEELLHEAPECWAWSRLGSAFDVRDGTHDTPKYYDRGVPLVTSKNLYSGMLDLAGCKLISEEDHASISERSAVDRDDILFAMIGTIGNPVIVDVNPRFSIKNVALFKYYDRSMSDPRYLLLYLKHVAAIMRSRAAGGLQPFVSLGFLRAFPIPLPPLAEQRRIVAKVDELMAVLDALEATLTTARTTSEKLLAATIAKLHVA